MPNPTFSRAQPATLRLVFDPDFASARAVSAAVRGFLAEQRVPDKELFSYELCIAEACYNAIEYAEGSAREFRPVADVLFTPDMVELRVTDHTAGFVLPGRIAPPSPMNERGRGLFLIQSVMDEVRYLRGADENTLVMRKRRRVVEPVPEARDGAKGGDRPQPGGAQPRETELPRAESGLRERVQKRVVARELEIAQEIQHLLLPRTLPQPAGFGLAGGWHSAREVGGDFYDAISLGGQSLLLMIVDVMGKGVPAALFATTMRGLLRGLASRSSDPAHLLSSLNRLLYKELSAVSMFITAQIVRVELQSRTVTAASAGHCPLLIIQPGRRTALAMPTQGIPIGVLPDTVYTGLTETLGTPAAVLLHTDGLTDTRNSAGKPFGQRRLMAWLRANALPGMSAGELRDSLTAELERFRGGAAMADDQAFLLLMEEDVGANEPLANGGRRIRIQQGSFLFPGNS